jgi:hypothetical protein
MAFAVPSLRFIEKWVAGSWRRFIKLESDWAETWTARELWKSSRSGDRTKDYLTTGVEWRDEV